MTGNLDINGNEITDASVIRGLSSAIYVANFGIFGDTGMAAYPSALLNFLAGALSFRNTTRPRKHGFFLATILLR